METFAIWASSFTSGLGLGGTNARNGLQFKATPVEKKKKNKPKVSKPRSPVGNVVPRILQSKATQPLDVWFEVPKTFTGRERRVCISGPHGPMQIELPEGTQPGQRIRHRLGPKLSHAAVVPEGNSAGDTISTVLPDGTTIQVVVPPGKKAGDEFEVSPPVLMVQVPEGARAGDTVAFVAPNGQELTAQVPSGVPSGRYFEMPYEMPNSEPTPTTQVEDGKLRTQATPPLDICFDVPEILHQATSSACVMGPHGPVQLPIPEGAKPGDRVCVRLGPKETFKAQVPEGLDEGDLMTLHSPDGGQLQLTVPAGKKEGDEIEVSPPVLMVRVPEQGKPGSQVVFTTPAGTKMDAVVPEGFPPASYFEVPMPTASHSQEAPAEEAESEAEEVEGVATKAEDPLREREVQNAPDGMQGDEIPEGKHEVADDILNFVGPSEDKENVQSPSRASPVKACLSPTQGSACLESGSSDLLTGEAFADTDYL